MRNGYVIELFKTRAKQPFFFRLKRGGRIVMQSEGYTRRAKRDRTAQRIYFDLSGCRLVDLNPKDGIVKR